MRKPSALCKSCLVLGFGCLLPSATLYSTEVQLHAQTKDSQTTFHLGEVISLELSYSLASSSSSIYEISNASYDRSGRLGIERFQIEPAAGWDDPLRLYFQSSLVYFGGGLSSSDRLSTRPAIIHRDLNEWVRFNQPGRYRVTVVSWRVSPRERSPEEKPFEIRSNEIWLTIIPATPAWQKATLDDAVAMLAKQRHNVSAGFADDSLRQAVAVLRYLGTPAAAGEMAARLNEPDTSFQFMLGLASTPGRAAALHKLEELLNDPVFPINSAFLYTIALVALPAEEISQPPEQRLQLQESFHQKLLSALAGKRGRALAISAYTFVETIGVSNPLSPDQSRRLTQSIVAGFDSLPISSQLDLLQNRWQALDKEALLPLLPKLAARYKDYPVLNETAAYEANGLSAAALERWWKLDPEAARPAVMQEILRPKPRFGVEVLGLLPDKQLPEIEQQLADHLTANFGNEAQTASLISRFATASVESQVAAYLDARIGTSACALQTPLLAYLLRVDPVAALPRLEEAMLARGLAHSACNHTLLVDVATLHNDPALEPLAIRSLDDQDPLIIANAAMYLERYGSAAAEAPLWDHLTAWSTRWKGHEKELRYVPGEPTDGPDQAAAGTGMIFALASAQGWLTDGTKLNRLVELSIEQEQRRQTTTYLDAWNARPRHIQFIPVGDGQFQIAQYHASSSAAAIAKLNQFQASTVFLWLGDLKQTGEEQAFQDLSNATAAHGITIRRSPVQ